MNYLEEDTWIEPESAAGPNNRVRRRGQALWGAFRLSRVRIHAACPDTAFSCPAKALGLGTNPRTWTAGYVYVEDGVLRFQHEEAIR